MLKSLKVFKAVSNSTNGMNCVEQPCALYHEQLGHQHVSLEGWKWLCVVSRAPCLPLQKSNMALMQMQWEIAAQKNKSPKGSLIHSNESSEKLTKQVALQTWPWSCSGFASLTKAKKNSHQKQWFLFWPKSSWLSPGAFGNTSVPNQPVHALQTYHFCGRTF